MKQLFKSIATALVDGLISLSTKLTISRAKKIKLLQDLVLVAAETECREELNLPLYGVDKDIDEELNRITEAYFYERDPSETDGIGQPSLKGADTWLEENAGELRKVSFQCRAWFYEKTDRQPQIRTLRSRYGRHYEGELVAIEPSEVTSRLKDAKKRFRAAQKRLRRVTCRLQRVKVYST